MNKAWHAAHKMPPNATREERIAWHAEHTRECACRPPPPSIAADVAAALKRKAPKADKRP